MNGDYLAFIECCSSRRAYKPTAQSRTRLPMNKGDHCVYHQTAIISGVTT